MKVKRLFFLTIFAMLVTLQSAAQLVGWVVDAQTGDSIPYASAIYRGNHVMVSGDDKGRFQIERHEGWYLTISAVGYKSQKIMIDKKTPNELHFALQQETKHLKEVVVKTKRSKYSRKNNPAVELMKRVIAAKKKTDLANHDYYQYDRYQKITTALNDLNEKDLEQGIFKKSKWLKDYVEVNPANDKLTLPLTVDELVTHHIYRKDPKSEKTIVMGENNNGINKFFETGDIITNLLKDVFTDVDIYDDQMRLLQYPFTSPIGKDAIAFYRYYIVDTVYVDKDLCYHLQFLPNNQQDFGFRGELYVLTDSTLHVKKCNLTIPKKSDVNFVDNMKITQEYTKLDNGEWVLSTDDMVIELLVAKFLSKALVVKTTRLSNYAFDVIPKNLFKGKAAEKKLADADMKDDSFWNNYRTVELSKGESSMDAFLHRIEQLKGWKYIIWGMRALVENFAETGSPSKVDIGPVNTMITRNFYDGFRTRISAETTANLNKHWFANGYFAHGWDTNNNYYKGELCYSFNEKEYTQREFPKRTLTFTSTYDVALPSDKYIRTDKDNIFVAMKWADIDKMVLYNRQELLFEREEDWGFKTTVGLKTEANEAIGNHAFWTLADLSANPDLTISPSGRNGKIRYTEAHAEIRIAPGETFISTKQRRVPLNLDAPVFVLGHTVGIKGVLGGQYNYNYSQLELYKRFWMKSWGKIDCYLKSGIIWDKVPYPLLIMPRANLGYIIEDETFNLINNMEFLNDRYASLEVSWDLNGKIFNRIPLLKKLKWREYIGVKGLWGTLTDKNNPYLSENAGDAILMPFPEGSYIMDSKKPYWELMIGVHNIFKILHVEYVRRLNYLELPTAQKHGVRFMFRVTF